MTTPRVAHRSLSTHTYIIMAMMLGLILTSYMLIRYGGLWGEQDTNAFSRAIASMVTSGELVPEGVIYPNGYGYQTLVVFLTQVSGVPSSFVQIYSSIVLAVWIIVPAWLFYRELLHSAKGATLGVLFLLVQPELLFVLARGSHEKFTRGLMLMSLYLLVRSLRSTNRQDRFISLVLCFYLTTFAVIAFNSFMANSFIIAVIFSLLLCWFITRPHVFLRDRNILVEPLVQRLIFVSVISLIFSFSFIFYVYPPAQHSLRFIGSITEQTAALVLDVEHEQSANPYETINTAWISLQVYLTVSIANWLLLIVSAIFWSAQTLYWLRKRIAPDSIGTLILWAFYAAFALQGAFSILADFSGAIGNLQHRVFPSFTLLAVPVIISVLNRWQPHHSYVRRLGYGFLSLGIGILMALAALKATNEPLLSNKWFFYQQSETIAIDWTNTYLQEQSLWVGIDERLPTAYTIQLDAHTPGISLDDFDIDRETRTFLLSDIIRTRLARVQAPLPVEMDSFVTYDNGQAQVYRLRPETPHQR